MNRAPLALLAALAPAAAAPPALAQTYVVPPALADAPGPLANYVPFGPPAADPQLRYQQAYGAALLAPIAGARLTGVAFRLAAGAGPLTPGPTYTGLEVWLSSAPGLVDALDRDLDANPGPNRVRVFQGDLTLPSLAAGGDPEAFELAVPLQVPFDYTGGDLLLELAYQDLDAPHVFGADAVWALGDGTSRAAETALGGAFVDSLGLVTRFAFEGHPVGESYCGPAALNSTGASASLAGWGWASVAVGDLTLTASDLPSHQTGTFLVADALDFVPFAGGSQGHLCLGGGVGRFLGQVGDTGAGHSLTLEVDPGALPPAGTRAVEPGETWYFQCWFLDLNPGPTSNFTDGLALTFGE